MAASVQHFFLNPSTGPPILNKTHKNPPLKISKLPQKSTKAPSLKEICHKSNLREALLSLANLLTEQNPPLFCLDEAYSSVLELCAIKKALSQGQQIHTHIIKSVGTYDYVFLSTKLLFMYGKCGSLLNAEKVFNRMCERTIFTWNAMIGAYVTNGEFFQALELYSEMRILGVPLDDRTFPCVLKACGTLMDISCGTEIHGQAIKLGFLSNVFVVNSLVGMYVKCGCLHQAMLLFERMSEKEDVVSWNSIISAYTANGQYVEALGLFREMQRSNLTPSTYTFVAALQACKDISLMKFGMEIHANLLKSTNYFDMYVANALVVMYLGCGKIGEAARIFEEMGERDNISWNSMISGFVQNGLYDEALRFFYKMQNSGKKPDQVSILSMLTTTGRLGNLLNGMEIHAYAIRNGLDSDLQVGNTLIDMYAKCCKINYMGCVFYRMPNKDFISWTTIIAGYAQSNSHSRALEMFRKFQFEDMEIDGMMIGSILLASSRLKFTFLVKEIHGYILRRGLSDLVLQNSILDVYSECENFDYAYRVFESIEDKDIVSMTSMISCYAQNGLSDKALDLFLSLKEMRIEPDAIAILGALSAAANLSALRQGKEIHGFLLRKGFILESSIASSLVDTYARCGTIEKSHNVFYCIEFKDLVMWTSMISALGMHGRGKEAIQIFKRMEDDNVIPDHVTFLALLHACSHSRLVNEGMRFFEIMKCEYKLEPWPEHYACLVDMLGRANHLNEAFEFVKIMPIEPTAAIWCSLLGACRVHSDKILGEVAAKKLLELDPGNPGNYILVSNVFASTGKWDDVKGVRILMKGKGLKKDPACSWIEIGKKVHTFIARDKSHPQSHEIYRKLAEITETLEREGGYVAQTRFVSHNVEEEEKVKIIHGHSERLAIAYGLLSTAEGAPLRVTKNLRVCGDCHAFIKLVSKFFDRKIIMRDANRFHHFESGICSCGDFW